MSDDDLKQDNYDREQSNPDEEPTESTDDQSSCVEGCLKGIFGCTVISIVVILILGASLYVGYPWNPWPSFRAQVTNYTIPVADKFIKELELPQSVEKKISERIKAIMNHYEKGEISTLRIIRFTSNIEKKLKDRNLIRLTSLDMAQSHLSKDSGLDSTEIKRARRTIQRLQRGIYKDEINASFVNKTIGKLISKNDDQYFSKNLSADDYRDTFKQIRRKVNKNRIPDTSFEINYGNEFRKLTNDLIKQSNNNSNTE